MHQLHQTPTSHLSPVRLLARRRSWRPHYRRCHSPNFPLQYRRLTALTFDLRVDIPFRAVRSSPTVSAAGLLIPTLTSRNSPPVVLCSAGCHVLAEHSICFGSAQCRDLHLGYRSQVLTGCCAMPGREDKAGAGWLAPALLRLATAHLVALALATVRSAARAAAALPW